MRVAYVRRKMSLFGTGEKLGRHVEDALTALRPQREATVSRHTIDSKLDLMPAEERESKEKEYGCIRRIPFDEFVTGLRESYHMAMEQGLDVGEAVFIMPKHEGGLFIKNATTSSWWVLMVLSEVEETFRIQPWQVVPLKDDRHFELSGQAAQATQFVYVDDAMYSGKQAAAAITTWAAAVEDAALFVIVPFCTTFAKASVEEIFDDDESTLVMCCANDILTTNQCIGSELYSPELTSTYFDHKLPDTHSTLGYIEHFIDCDKTLVGLNEDGTDECILPPYKNPSGEPPKKVELTTHDINTYSRAQLQNAYYILPQSWDSFAAFDIPEGVKWSHVIIPGQHDTYVTRLKAEDTVFVMCGYGEQRRRLNFQEQKDCRRVLTRRVGETHVTAATLKDGVVFSMG